MGASRTSVRAMVPKLRYVRSIGTRLAVVTAGIVLLVAAGKSATVSGQIVGAGAGLVIRSAGAVVLSGANSFTGGITLQSGVLDLANASAAGTGEITFAGAAATLVPDGPAARRA